jgi:ribosomal protein S18 acetylase RimI-like enzyme
VTIDLEHYDTVKHDEHTVARLILESDPFFNTLVYGQNAVVVIQRLLRLKGNFFDSTYTRCALYEGGLAGVIVGFPVAKKAEIDKSSGRTFAQAMGFFRLIMRMPLFIRMDRMMPPAKDATGYYLHTLSVDAQHRSRGLGSEIIKQVVSDKDPVYLHVNRDNHRAIRFYEQNGFQRLAEGSMAYKGRELSQVLMGRT